MEKLKSEGICVFCEETIAQAGMTRHLGSHLKNITTGAPSKERAFHVKVQANEMFLHLLVDGKETLGDLDAFLRNIWLECCGHLSSFEVKGANYRGAWDADSFGEDMGKPMQKIFSKGIKLNYEYDFGSTTQLDVQVMGEYAMPVLAGIMLLSRNEPLEILCHVCEKKPAVIICPACVYNGPSMFCTTCAKKHKKECEDFDDDYSLPVVNSPRMGVCGYEGGMIDVERDGPWKPQKAK